MEPITIALVAAGVWLFAPSPAKVLGRESAKPDAAIVAKADGVEATRAALQYWMDAAHDAVARAEKLQAQADAAQGRKDEATDRVVLNAQANNQMVLDILRSIPPAERTPKTILATLLASKTDAGLSGLVGDLSPARQLELAKLCQDLLAEDDKIRAAAEAKVAEADKERQAALVARARADGELVGVKASLADQKAVVADAQQREKAASETLKVKTDELRSELRMQATRAASDVWFWRWFFAGFVGLLILTGRVFPAVEKYFGWAWLHPLNKLNAWIFELLTGREIK